MCRVKFGAFYDYIEQVHRDAFDRIASGHYARVLRSSPESPVAESIGDKDSPSLGDSQAHDLVRLALTDDPIKDQTYFLAHLSPGQLQRAMFPLGPFTKSMVRGLAAAADLPNKYRKDSQGICFLGRIDFAEFVEGYLGEEGLFPH
jgi:tRNA U34 2-thiouridine synthase MnmA/TrmU